MQSEDADLQSLVEAVADGSGVDWEHAEASAAPDERELIRQLRLLANVGTAARTHAAVWGPLQIRGDVGSGTFGTVYRAWDPRLDREVALKLLHAGSDEQIASTVIKEGSLLARIRHPNVVTVFGADVFDGRVGLWMEFVHGRTLKDIVHEHGPFGAHEAALIGLDLCRALAAVHAAGFLHRDIKAQNVMREAGGRIVLMDFGAGEGVDAADDGSPGMTGTPLYLAPEVLAGGRHTVKSDLYSLGVLLYYLVSGQFPVSAGSLSELRFEHAQGRRAHLRDIRPDLPAPFVRAIDSAMAADPAERPESAGALEAMLEAALGLRQRAIAMRRQVVAYALAALLLIGVVGLGPARSLWQAKTVAPRNSVAILPFKNLSGDKDNDYFSEGVTADIVAHLATLRGLTVVSGASVGPYMDRKKSVTEIGADLGVAAVLDGSVRRSGTRVRINSQLLDAATGEQLWGDSYDRDVADIFSIQSEVSRRIALALRGELSQEEADRLGHARTSDFEVFNLYIKGRYYWSLRSEDGFRRSIQYFDDALKRDPNYAPAYAGLADAYNLQGVYGMIPRAEAAARAREAAMKAIQLDESLPEAHASLGYVQKNSFEWAAAEKSFKRALDLKPGYAEAHHWYAVYLAQVGRFAEAIREIKAAIELDPLSVSANCEFAIILMFARRHDEAITQLERTLSMDSSSPTAHQVMAEVSALKGDYERALASANRAAKTGALGGQDEELQADIGFILARAGRRREALAIVDRLLRRAGQGEAVSAEIATILGALGEREKAFVWLARARDQRESGIGHLKVDPRWDALRGDPRFDAILASLGLADQAQPVR